MRERLLWLLFWIVATAYWCSQAIGDGRAFWSWAWGALLGLYVGRLLTMAYRRGEVLTLKRELAALRGYDEDED